MILTNMIAVTAFTEFGTIKGNSSLEALSGANLSNEFSKHILSVDLKDSRKELDEIISQNPKCIIMFGQYGGTIEIRVEERAKNILDFRIPDNGGNFPHNIPIIDGGSEYLESSFDTHKITEYLINKGFNTRNSDDAGTFICNFSYYYVLSKGIKAVFVHLPLYLEQSSNLMPYWTKEELSKVVEEICNFIKEDQE